MKELELAVAELIKHSDKTILGTTDKVISQFPEIAHQMVIYGVFDGIVGAVFFGITNIALIIGIKKMFKIIKREDEEINDTSGEWAIQSLLFFFLLISSVMLCVNIEQIAKCKLAPKLYVSEQVLKISKGGN